MTNEQRGTVFAMNGSRVGQAKRKNVFDIQQKTKEADELVRILSGIITSATKG